MPLSENKSYLTTRQISFIELSPKSRYLSWKIRRCSRWSVDSSNNPCCFTMYFRICIGRYFCYSFSGKIYAYYTCAFLHDKEIKTDLRLYFMAMNVIRFKVLTESNNPRPFFVWINDKEYTDFYLLLRPGQRTSLCVRESGTLSSCYFTVEAHETIPAYSMKKCCNIWKRLRADWHIYEDVQIDTLHRKKDLKIISSRSAVILCQENQLFSSPRF